MNFAPATSLRTLEVGQALEMQKTDFSKPGMPKVWVVVVIEEITLKGKLRDLKLGYDGTFRMEIVGPQGGNPALRIIEGK